MFGPLMHKKKIITLLFFVLLALFFTTSAWIVRSNCPSQAAHSEASGSVPVDAEKLEPDFDDFVTQADYAILQTLFRLGVPDANIRAEHGGLREQGGQVYQFRILHIYAVSDVPFFSGALADALIAWAEQARLSSAGEWAQARDGRLNISINGIVTHELNLHALALPEAWDEFGGKPCLAIVIDDVGESMRLVRELLSLDFPLTFAVWPYSTHAFAAAEAIHAGGGGVIVHQPMEPVDYPDVHPGKGALLRGMDSLEIARRLEESFRRVPHALGLNNHMGSLFTQDAEKMRVVAAVLKKDGFFALDSLTHARSRFVAAALSEGLEVYKRDVFLDVLEEKNYILGQLSKAERLAKLNGQAVAIGHARTPMLEALSEWQGLRDRSVWIVPLKNLTPLGSERNKKWKQQ